MMHWHWVNKAKQAINISKLLSNFDPDLFPDNIKINI